MPQDIIAHLNGIVKLPQLQEKLRNNKSAMQDLQTVNAHYVRVSDIINGFPWDVYESNLVISNITSSSMSRQFKNNRQQELLAKKFLYTIKGCNCKYVITFHAFIIPATDFAFKQLIFAVFKFACKGNQDFYQRLCSCLNNNDYKGINHIIQYEFTPYQLSDLSDYTNIYALLDFYKELLKLKFGVYLSLRHELKTKFGHYIFKQTNVIDDSMTMGNLNIYAYTNEIHHNTKSNKVKTLLDFDKEDLRQILNIRWSYFALMYLYPLENEVKLDTSSFKERYDSNFNKIQGSLPKVLTTKLLIHVRGPKVNDSMYFLKCYDKTNMQTVYLRFKL